MAKDNRIGLKVRKLMREGKSQKAALGEAYGMKRAGRLTKRGGYRRVKRGRRGRR
jgi:hypothetical protein